METYLLFVYNHHHGVAYIENLNHTEIPVDEYTKVQLRYLYLVQNTAPYIVDAAAKSAAIKLFKEKEGGFDRYYKVIRISDTGDMYDITDESEMKLVIELVPE